jgi:hypothetical protein
MSLYSLRLEDEVIARLKEIPNGAERARNAIKRDLELYDDTILNARIRQVKKRIIEDRSLLLDHERELGDLEAQKVDSDERWKKWMDARLRCIEHIRRQPQTKLDVWLEPRLAECGWSSVREAKDWIAQEMAKLAIL